MRKRIILSICLLVCGIFIYLFFNSEFIDKSNIVTTIIRNFIPDLLWAMSFFFFSIVFARKVFKHYKIVNSLYVLIIGICFELLQLINVVNGTFDMLDIFVYVLSVLLANLIDIYIWRNEYE